MAITGFGTETEWQFDSADLAPLRAQLHSSAELAGFRLVAASPHDLDDCYLDTADARFAQAGYALRLRVDGPAAEATLKSIGGDGGDGPRVRTEIRQSMTTGDLDSLLSTHGPVAERVRAIAGEVPLTKLFQVRTHRDVWQALLGEVDAAEIVLDESRIDAGNGSGEVALKRVEVELHQASATALQPLITQLTTDSDLAPATRSKFQTGVSIAGLPPPEMTLPLPEPVIEPGMSVIDAGQLLLRQRLRTWRQLEAAVRLDADVEALHQLRVCARRMIGALRLMESAPLARARQLRLRFQRAMRYTAVARDLDVQCRLLAMLPDAEGRAALQPLLVQLRRQRRREQTLLVRRLNSRRTVQLLQCLNGLATTPIQRRIVRKIGAVSGPLLLRRYRKLRQQAQPALASGTIESLHALRLQAKKLRYLAEPLVRAAYGTPLRRLLRRLHGLQTLLGDLNDAEQLAQGLSNRLLHSGTVVPAATAFAMGRIVELQHSRVRELKPQLAGAWRRVSGKRWRRLRRALRTAASGDTGVAGRD